MPGGVLVSYAQNGEDIVLWRALRHVTEGTYVDVGGWDPDLDSVTRLFYERGWRGVDVEPVPEFAQRFRDRRPGNDVVQAVITDVPSDRVVLHRFGTTGLSTLDDDIAGRHDDAGLDHQDIVVPGRSLDEVLAGSPLVDGDIHFLKIDVEGAEDRVLKSLDLARWRPWVLVVEATEPNSTTSTHGAWEPILLAAGYVFTLFDGLSRFYVSADHPELTPALSYPACALDEFQLAREVELHDTVVAREVERDAAQADALAWQDQATLASTDAEQLRVKLARVQTRLQRLRAQRKELRARIRRLRARSKRRSRRIQRLTRALDERPAGPPPLHRRVRSAAKRVTGR